MAELSGLEAQNLGDLEAEVGFHLGCFLLADVQQAGELCGVVGIGLGRVDGDDVAELGALELGFLLVALHVFGQHDGLLDLDASFEGGSLVVELLEQTLDHVARLVAVGLDLLSAALAEALHLLVHQSVVHLDVVVGEFVLLREFCVELGGECDVEGEGEILLCLEVDGGSLFLVGQRLGQHVHLVLADILVDFLADEFVDFLGHDFLAEALLDEGGGHLAGTESGQACLFAEVFQGGCHFSFVVSLLDVDGEQGAHLVDVFKRDIHCTVFFICGCKGTTNSSKFKVYS